MADHDFIKKVRANSPFPWSQVVHPNGIVQVFDVNGREVPLFTLTEFAIFLSNVMNKKEAA